MAIEDKYDVCPEHHIAYPKSDECPSCVAEWARSQQKEVAWNGTEWA